MKKTLLFSVISFIFFLSTTQGVLGVDQCSCTVQFNVGTYDCEATSVFAIGNTPSNNIAGVIGWVLVQGQTCVPAPRDSLFQINDLDRLLNKLTAPIATTPLSSESLCQNLCDLGNDCDDSGAWRTRVRCEYIAGVAPPTSSALAPVFVPPPSIPLINPLTGTTSSESIPDFVGNIIERVLGILGSISLVVFMYGAFKWITSEGESDDIAEGTHTMAYAAIGILVIFASYGILSSVIGGITRGG